MAIESIVRDFERCSLASVLTVVLLAAPIHAQISAEHAHELKCLSLKNAPKRLLVAPTITDSLKPEACKAVGLAARALRRKLKTIAIDSLIVTKHDFPTLESSNVNSVYQVGSFLADGSYWECVVDRKTWATVVQFREGR